MASLGRRSADSQPSPRCGPKSKNCLLAQSFLLHMARALTVRNSRLLSRAASSVVSLAGLRAAPGARRRSALHSLGLGACFTRGPLFSPQPHHAVFKERMRVSGSMTSKPFSLGRRFAKQGGFSFMRQAGFKENRYRRSSTAIEVAWASRDGAC